MTVKCLGCGLIHEESDRVFRTVEGENMSHTFGYCPKAGCGSFWTVDEAKVESFLKKIGK